ncbi:MAG: cation diffusion facilitator family transporter, partial [Gemmatimonadaceae bacterium]
MHQHDGADPHAGHAHGHGHGHAHTHGATGEEGVRRLRMALALTATFLLAEVVGGIVSNSLALLADAGHMLTDTAALALSLFVAWFSKRPETPKRTYGYLRLEILAAFLNGSVLLLVSAWIIWEAIVRLSHPEPLRGGIMLVVAGVGLAVNLAAAWVLRPAQGGHSFVFRHELFREAAYGDVLPGERRRLHRALGEVLVARPDLVAGAGAGGAA